MDKFFCENLKAARKHLGLTQSQVALQLCVTPSCYANWEQGRTEPPITQLRALSKILDEILDNLIGTNNA